MEEEKSLVFSLKHRPPLTISMVTAALLMLLVYKNTVIGELPIKDKALLKTIGDWYTWILNFGGTVFSLLSLFLGVKKTPAQTA